MAKTAETVVSEYFELLGDCWNHLETNPAITDNKRVTPEHIADMTHHLNRSIPGTYEKQIISEVIRQMAEFNRQAFVAWMNRAKTKYTSLTLDGFSVAHSLSTISPVFINKYPDKFIVISKHDDTRPQQVVGPNAYQRYTPSSGGSAKSPVDEGKKREPQQEEWHKGLTSAGGAWGHTPVILKRRPAAAPEKESQRPRAPEPVGKISRPAAPAKESKPHREFEPTSAISKSDDSAAPRLSFAEMIKKSAVVAEPSAKGKVTIQVADVKEPEVPTEAKTLTLIHNQMNELNLPDDHDGADAREFS